MRTEPGKLAEAPLSELELRVRVVLASRLEWQCCISTAFCLTVGWIGALEEAGSSSGQNKKAETVDSL